jgi:hypothetical protein
MTESLPPLSAFASQRAVYLIAKGNNINAAFCSGLDYWIVEEQ